MYRISHFAICYKFEIFTFRIKCNFYVRLNVQLKNSNKKNIISRMRLKLTLRGATLWMRKYVGMNCIKIQCDVCQPWPCSFRRRVARMKLAACRRAG